MILFTKIKLLLLLGTLLAACYTDLKYKKIFNGLILFSLICSFGISVLENRLSGIQFFFSGLFFAFISFMPLYLVRGMAAGDVKLISVIGSIVGTNNWIIYATSIYIAGGLVAFLVVVYKRKIFQLVSNLNSFLFFKLQRQDIQLSTDNQTVGINSVGRMPFAVAIFVGAAFAHFYINGFLS